MSWVVQRRHHRCSALGIRITPGPGNLIVPALPPRVPCHREEAKKSQGYYEVLPVSLLPLPPLVLSKTKQSDSVDSCSGVRVTRFDTEAWERSLPSLDSRHSAIPLLSPACSTVGARLEVTVGSTEGVAVACGGSSREPPQATAVIRDMITERATICFLMARIFKAILAALAARSLSSPLT